MDTMTDEVVRPDRSTLTDRVRVEATTLREVARFASTDESRPTIAAVAVWTGPDGVTLAATDSYRLLIDGPLPTERPTFLLPVATVRALIANTGKRGVVHLVRTDTDEVWAESFDGKRRLRFSPSVVDEVDGTFPNVTGLLPDTDGEHTVELPSDASGTLRGLGKLAGANSVVAIDGDGTATVNLDRGTWTAKRFATVSDSAPTVAFSPTFLADVIDATTWGPIPTTLHVRDQLRPLVARGRGRTVLLMPMRVN